MATFHTIYHIIIYDNSYLKNIICIYIFISYLYIFSFFLNFRYAICGTGDNQLRIIGLGVGPEEKYQVSHSQEITCLVVTPDSRSLITGSRDMSLKVWQLAGGKLSQVYIFIFN